MLDKCWINTHYTPPISWFAFALKTISPMEGARFVVSAKNEQVSGIFDLVTKQQRHRFDLLRTSGGQTLKYNKPLHCCQANSNLERANNQQWRADARITRIRQNTRTHTHTPWRYHTGRPCRPEIGSWTLAAIHIFQTVLTDRRIVREYRPLFWRANRFR